MKQKKLLFLLAFIFSFAPFMVYSGSGSELFSRPCCVEDTTATEPLKTVIPELKEKTLKPLKVFSVYPAVANHVLYVQISGKQILVMRNAADSLIFRASIREKAVINIMKLPEGKYYLSDEKTGAKRSFVIER